MSARLPWVQVWLPSSKRGSAMSCMACSGCERIHLPPAKKVALSPLARSRLMIWSLYPATLLARSQRSKVMATTRRPERTRTRSTSTRRMTPRSSGRTGGRANSEGEPSGWAGGREGSGWPTAPMMRSAALPASSAGVQRPSSKALEPKDRGCSPAARQGATAVVSQRQRQSRMFRTRPGAFMGRGSCGLATGCGAISQKRSAKATVRQLPPLSSERDLSARKVKPQQAGGLSGLRQSQQRRPHRPVGHAHPNHGPGLRALHARADGPADPGVMLQAAPAPA